MFSVSNSLQDSVHEYNACLGAGQHGHGHSKDALGAESHDVIHIKANRFGKQANNAKIDKIADIGDPRGNRCEPFWLSSSCAYR